MVSAGTVPLLVPNLQGKITTWYGVQVKGSFTPYFDVPKPNELLALQKVFGANVRRERHLRGLTQERLAELAELSLRNVQRIEAGEINVLMTTVVRIRRALDCSAGDLLPHG